MQKEEFAEAVRMLERPESYFGFVAHIAEVSGLSVQESWIVVENERHELGLSPRYTTYSSFRKAKSIHHAQNGVVIIPRT